MKITVSTLPGEPLVPFLLVRTLEALAERRKSVEGCRILEDRSGIEIDNPTIGTLANLTRIAIIEGLRVQNFKKQEAGFRKSEVWDRTHGAIRHELSLAMLSPILASYQRLADKPKMFPSLKQGDKTLPEYEGGLPVINVEAFAKYVIERDGDFRIPLCQNLAWGFSDSARDRCDYGVEVGKRSYSRVQFDVPYWAAVAGMIEAAWLPNYVRPMSKEQEKKSKKDEDREFLVVKPLVNSYAAFELAFQAAWDTFDRLAAISGKRLAEKGFEVTWLYANPHVIMLMSLIRLANNVYDRQVDLAGFDHSCLGFVYEGMISNKGKTFKRRKSADLSATDAFMLMLKLRELPVEHAKQSPLNDETGLFPFLAQQSCGQYQYDQIELICTAILQGRSIAAPFAELIRYRLFSSRNGDGKGSPVAISGAMTRFLMNYAESKESPVMEAKSAYMFGRHMGDVYWELRTDNSSALHDQIWRVQRQFMSAAGTQPPICASSFCARLGQMLRKLQSGRLKMDREKISAAFVLGTQMMDSVNQPNSNGLATEFWAAMLKGAMSSINHYGKELVTK